MDSGTIGTRQSKHTSKPEVVDSIMLLCQGRDTSNVAYWAYICMLPTHAELFAQARNRGRLDLEDYGTIIEYGQGEQPPPEVKKRMREQFGFQDDYEEQLLKIIEQMGGSSG